MGRGRQGTGVEVHRDKLRIRFTFNGERRVEPLQLRATPPNIKAANRLAEEVRKKIDLGVFDYAATFPNSKHIEAVVVETVSAYAKVWLKTLVGEKSTKLGYSAAINKFWLTTIVGDGTKEVPFGDLLLPQVRHTHIATAIANKANEGATGKTTNNLLIPLRAMFNAAKADGKIEVSPVANVKNRKHQRKEIDPFTREEMEIILRHMDRYPKNLEVIANYFRFAFAAGMRPSELIALRWGDVDWVRKIVHVSRAQVRHAEKGTKTHQARNVDLTPLAIAALVAQKAHTFMKGPNEAIFCSPEGDRWLSERRLREDFFQPCLKAVGIRQRPAYNTRHTYATVALMAGINPAYIAGQLGHANTAMLFKHYAKWIEGADSGKEAGKLGAVFDAQTGRIGPNLAPAKQEAN